MKFAIGYQLADEGEESTVDIVRDYLEQVEEVYFPWANMPSGRAPLGSSGGCFDWKAQQTLEKDLVALKGMGVKLDILFNANCYGAKATSQYFENTVGSILEHLKDVVGGVDVVTTTSLAVARTVKKYFPQIDVRASVNMRLGTIQSMDYVKGLFDSYYIQRDVQRNIEYVRSVKQWADANGKKLCMLANSGCLRYCPGQTFHDNLVAHEAEIAETANIEGWNPHVCWNHYADQDNWASILRATWIRPEDLHNYDDIFPVVKLATRMHGRPRMVVAAYTSGKYYGNLLDLFEPGFSNAFSPYIIDNTKFPDDWFVHTSKCEKCSDCEYCRSVLEKVLVKLG